MVFPQHICYHIAAMNDKSILFSPINIGKLTIANRFVRSATHAYMADKNGFVTDRQIGFLEEIARGEAGLIISGHTYVNPSGIAGIFQTGIHTDEHIHGLSRLAEAIHKYSSRLFLQLSHAGRQTKTRFCGCIPLAPSAVYEPIFKITPREMTGVEIEGVIDDFIQGARRAKEAGWDGVQLHAAHGYLLSSFISPYTNRRDDEWGGSVAKRAWIVVRILEGIKELLGTDYPVIVKLNSTDLLPKGLTIEESIEIAGLLERSGIDGIEVSGGMSEAGKASVWEGPFTEDEEGYFVDNAELIKAAVNVPVFGLGGLRTFTLMEKAVNEGKVDLISMSRPFIREPHLVKKFRTGEIKRSKCISCNKCFNPRGIRCAVTKNE